MPSLISPSQYAALVEQQYQRMYGDQIAAQNRPRTPGTAELLATGLGGAALGGLGGALGRPLGEAIYEKGVSIYDKVFGDATGAATGASTQGAAGAVGAGVPAATAPTVVGGGATGTGALPALTPPATAPTTALPTAGAAGTPGGFSLGGIGTAGNYLLPAAGVLGLGDVLISDRGPERGAAQGAASGAAIGSYFGPVGAGIGVGVGGLIGLGKGLLDDSSQTEVEQDRWKDLQGQGIEPFNPLQTDPDAKQYVAKGVMFRPDLGPDFVGNDPESGEWVNNRFSVSRSEADLTARDIWGYAAFPEKFGSAWMTAPEEAREIIAGEALRRGLVDEHRGTIDLRSDPDFEQFAADVLGAEEVDQFRTEGQAMMPTADQMAEEDLIAQSLAESLSGGF